MKEVALLLLLTLFGKYLFAQNVVDKNADTTVVSFAENPPEYPGGMVALQKFLANNLSFPKICDDLNGRAVVQFIVERNGSLSNVEFIRTPPCEAFKNEILRTIQSMPKWIPAVHFGNQVRCYYKLPILLCFR